MNFRTYDPEQDKKAVRRIWREVSWVDGDAHEQAMEVFLAAGRGLVADLNGEAECLAHMMPGEIRYLDEDLSFAAVTAVTTSRIARRQGLAKRLTARLIADAAAEGAMVAGLGIFEQGFYNLLGFGSGGYEHWIGFDPAQLNINERPRVPRRLSKDDAALMHRAMLRRRRGHGGLNILPEAYIKAEATWSSNGFGLGYEEDGELTHFFWCSAKGEHGPYTIVMYAYQSMDQFRELMALVRSLGDQVRKVRMREPQGVQIQDLIVQPFRYRQLTQKGEYENANSASAYWQIRVCDLAGCLEKTHLRGEPVRFNLELSDPIAQHLDEDSPWRGIGGRYVVTLGPSSSAAPGADASLPTLKASVGAFSRMWFGVRPASGLAVTDDLSGPPDLLKALDWALRIPEPKPGWDF
jgi:hypothetical protein